jgi:hypothetical protein
VIETISDCTRCVSVREIGEELAEGRLHFIVFEIGGRGLEG